MAYFDSKPGWLMRQPTAGPLKSLKALPHCSPLHTGNGNNLVGVQPSQGKSSAPKPEKKK